MEHRAGFVNIIGLPNVGKSTLMNALVGERMSIITSKAQTTRHRILGIVNGEDFQIVYSDTPGIIRQTAYKLQAAMNKFVDSSFEDADVILFVTHKYAKPEDQEEIAQRLEKSKVPVFVVINKSDLATAEEHEELMAHWQKRLNAKACFSISALEKTGLEELFDGILNEMPVSPPFYDKEALTDRPERFFVSEIVREKIFLNYKQEVPYSTEVGIESFQEDEKIVRIRALIFVNRKTHKPIIIGKGGESIKKVGIAARQDIEAFLQKRVHLELFVKIKENWRDRDGMLRQFGYN